MYCNITHILEDLDENTLLQLCNDKNRQRSSIDLENPDDEIIVLINQQISRAEEEINPFLIPLKVLPFTVVPERIKTITIKITIKNLYQRSPGYRANMPESITNDYKDCLKELDAYRKRERIIPGLETIESAKPSLEIKINKTEADRIFSSQVLNKF
jgi:hypothetical protein